MIPAEAMAVTNATPRTTRVALEKSFANSLRDQLTSVPVTAYWPGTSDVRAVRARSRFSVPPRMLTVTWALFSPPPTATQSVSLPTVAATPARSNRDRASCWTMATRLLGTATARVSGLPQTETPLMLKRAKNPATNPARVSPETVRQPPLGSSSRRRPASRVAGRRAFAVTIRPRTPTAQGPIRDRARKTMANTTRTPLVSSFFSSVNHA
ncbi:hypothetical protein GCM10012285_03740 [Streptomyces kronopolitis]|uniref:Uncharacterized protein n=1 Tax=Streptomyces kronopolitis TaxID=1612435 RepID=A0ABQ2IWC7_9ACTN|nr:hypothetical protein [Streptomyces kronopolitis]GGN33016.1 hypothetical protein GCM10012285_03740 [Streptomyces kronopolitis]